MKKIFLLVSIACSFVSVAQHANADCSSKAEKERLRAILDKNLEKLRSMGKLKFEGSVQPDTYSANFIWPMVAAPNYYQPGFYYISKYVDLDPSSSGTSSTVLDYNCGDRTYDNGTNGYDHDGIDIAIGPYGWTMYDNNSAYAVAAMGGEIVDKHDGEFSRTCTWGVSATNPGNYITIRHSNGLTTYYMHLKQGTLTAKEIGDDVATGEFLGVVGSSGNSTGPHLHFQTEETNYPFRTVDPFQNGGCHNDLSGQITSSLWANEEPYENRKILSVFTTSGTITNSTCDSNGYSHGYSGVVPYQNHFATNSIVYFKAAVRDMSPSYPIRIRIYSPSNTELYDHTITTSEYVSLAMSSLDGISVGSEQGVYRIRCTYSGQEYYHFFTVGCPGSQTLSGTRASHTAAISGGTINTTETVPPSTYNAEYQAETMIVFNPGFAAEAGCEFRARIDACTVGGQKQVKEPDTKKKIQR